MNWLTIAENLPLGHKTRSNCECGDGKTLLINHTIKGYSCFCFRCSEQQFVAKGKQTLADLEKLKKLNEEAENIQLKMELPSDYTQEIPLVGRLWLYSGGIVPRQCRHYKIGYSESLNRVILPVFDDGGKLIWYQCRAIINGQKPKYIQPSQSRDTILFKAGWSTTTPERVIIVEDYLSAVRVGEVNPAVSLLGTKITTGQAAVFVKVKRCTTWLDSDKAGRDGSVKIRRVLSLVSDVDNIVTEKDPKLYSNQEIQEIIK